MDGNVRKTALIIGATGLVGNYLLHLLLHDDYYDKVVIFVRKSTNIDNPKLIEYIVDFAAIDTWKELIKGDVLFSALGTTIAKAGSKQRQYEVDYSYQYNTASEAQKNGIENYVLVSSANASANSLFFYPKMKARLELAVERLGFDSVSIIQPNLLYGDRTEKRGGEEFAFRALTKLNKIGLFSNSKPIHGNDVAKAMIYASHITEGLKVYKGNELSELATKYDE